MTKVRWLGALVAAGALVVAGAGSAGADDGSGDPVRGVPRTVALDTSPASVAVSPDGRKAYVSVKDSTHGAKLKVVDTQSGAITATVTLTTGFGADAGPVAVSPDGSRVYVLFGPSRKIPLSLLGTVDTATNTLVSTTEAPDQPRPDGTNPGGLAALTVSPDGTRVFVTQNGPAAFHRPPQEGTRVLEFSARRQAYTAAVQVPGHYAGSVVVRPDGDDAYAGTDEGLTHLDTSEQTPVVAGTVPVPVGPFVGLALSPDDTRLYGVGGGKGYAVDLATDTVTATMDIAPGQRLSCLSTSADGTRLYMLVQDSSVLALDTATNTPVPGEGVTGLTYVTSMAVGPDGHTFYVTANASLQIIGF
ncbi:YncE family protein [Kitasatospora sp. NPDC093558]|uniref:YncE family protein n=1 Tax=Kitasatospora sp. NPDC093558 TaxID=3155201 RepID=UPI003413C9C0